MYIFPLCPPPPSLSKIHNFSTQSFFFYSFCMYPIRFPPPHSPVYTPANSRMFFFNIVCVCVCFSVRFYRIVSNFNENYSRAPMKLCICSRSELIIGIIKLKNVYKKLIWPLHYVLIKKKGTF